MPSTAAGLYGRAGGHCPRPGPGLPSGADRRGHRGGRGAGRRRSGRGVAGTVAVAAAVLAGQLSVGWMNDYLDRDRDVRVRARRQAGGHGPAAARTLRAATVVAAVAVVPLSLLSGRAGRLAAPARGGVGLGVQPAAEVDRRCPSCRTRSPSGCCPRSSPPGCRASRWSAGWSRRARCSAPVRTSRTCCRTSTTICATGVRGLPHRIGPTGSRVAAAVLLTGRLGGAGGGAAGAAGRARESAPWWWPWCAGSGRPCWVGHPGSRAAFLGVLVVAAVDVALLVGSGEVRLALTCAGRRGAAPLR